jgi:hypothetical protein
VSQEQQEPFLAADGDRAEQDGNAHGCRQGKEES